MNSLCEYTSEGHIVEPWIGAEFIRGLEKRPRLNPTGQDCHLHTYGWVTRDEDKIIAAQRIWKERVYAPGGLMYRKALERFSNQQRKAQGDGSPDGRPEVVEEDVGLLQARENHKDSKDEV